MRPRVGTYGLYEYEKLPALPFELKGEFDWLEAAASYRGHIGAERGGECKRALPALRAEASRAGVELPADFLRFMESVALQRHMRSCTDCLFDLSAELVVSPRGGGYLVRFLADSQGCVFWYLYISEKGCAVVTSPDFYGAEEEQWQEEPGDPAKIVFCAESFEEFICRFWLENEIWYAGYEKRALSGVQAAYVQHYRRGQ